MNRKIWIDFLKTMKTKLKMTHLGLNILKSDLSANEIIPLIEPLTRFEKSILTFSVPSAISFRIEVANQRLITRRYNEFCSEYRKGRGKEYLMSLPHWSLIIELRSFSRKNDEDMQIYHFIKRAANEAIYSSDPIVSKIIKGIQHKSPSIKQVVAQIDNLDTYEKLAIWEVKDYQDCLPQNVIDVLNEATKVLGEEAEKRISFKNDNELK